MAEQEILNFIGEQFRRLNGRFDKLELDIGNIKTRLIVLKEGQASMSARIATVEVGMAGINKRMDRVESRLDRIERRLDLVETI
jgi:tetrahydromethanopterin S-methyltransferase subunit G